MAEWFADGLLERLTDSHDAVARHLLRDACVFVMPNVNPDGTWRGHLRTNAAGECLLLLSKYMCCGWAQEAAACTHACDCRSHCRACQLLVAHVLG